VLKLRKSSLAQWSGAAPVYKGVHLSVGVNLLMAQKYCQAGLWLILTDGKWFELQWLPK
jgi:hypothetical protein